MTRCFSAKFCVAAPDVAAVACDTDRVLLLADTRTTLVRERWARVEQLGLRRDAEAFPEGTSDADLVDRRDRLENAFREERQLLDRITEPLCRGPLVTVIADRDGVILSARSDPRSADPMTRVRLVDGACWGEDTRGTNAIGTAIREGCPVAVVGEAHYELRNRGLFCYATPVHDAYGDVVAVLDVTGPLPSHDPTLGRTVHAAGLALERALRMLAYGSRSAVQALERLVHHEPALLIDRAGEVCAANGAAGTAFSLRIDDASRAAGALQCERLFGIGFSALLATALKKESARFSTRQTEWTVTIEPITGLDGRALALLVHFSKVTSRASVAPAPMRPPVVVSGGPFETVLGQDPTLRRAKELAARLAKTSLPMLLLAETGTGKELFARAIHAASARASGPFVAVNCGALSPTLIASELFGVAPFAFTGASRTGSEGRLAAAHGGTLFLDEIGEMPGELQAALLRVLESGVYQRVGETKDRRSDFRLVCATCRDLPTLVRRGTFRSDLFYRIHGASVRIPSLRDRTDILWLANELFARARADLPAPPFDRATQQFIQRHDWPGNVRELKSAMEHAAALAEEIVGMEQLPQLLLSPPDLRPDTTRKGILQSAIEQTLEACAGNVSEAARRLGVGRGTVYRALKTRKPD